MKSVTKCTWSDLLTIGLEMGRLLAHRPPPAAPASSWTLGFNSTKVSACCRGSSTSHGVLLRSPAQVGTYVDPIHPTWASCFPLGHMAGSVLCHAPTAQPGRRGHYCHYSPGKCPHSKLKAVSIEPTWPSQHQEAKRSQAKPQETECRLLTATH